MSAESAPPAAAAASSPRPRSSRLPVLALAAAVALWLFAGQGGLSHPVQLCARGLIIIAAAAIIAGGVVRFSRLQFILLTLFAGWGFLTGFGADCQYLARQEWLTWLTAAAAALAGQSLFTEFPKRRWWLWLAIILTATAVPELARNLAAFGAAGLAINLTGLPENSNVLGVILALCIPATAAALADPADRKLGVVAAPLLALGLLMTYSRNAWLTAMAGLAVWWYLAHRGQRVKLLAAVLAVVLILLAVPATRGRLHSFVDPNHPSNIERVDLFRAVGKYLNDDGRRWWLGGGMGEWGFLYPRYAGPGMKWQLHTHNLISEWLLGGGLPLVLLGFGVVIAGMGRDSSGASPVRYAQLVVILLANMFDYLLWIPLTAFLAFAIILRRGPECQLPGPDRRLVPLALTVLLVVMSVLPLAGWYEYRDGLAAGRVGEWEAAEAKFANAVFYEQFPGIAREPHPIYTYYQALAFWRYRGQPLTERMGYLIYLSESDPFFHQQEKHGFSPEWQAELRAQMNKLDPQQMIAGGEEFPRPVKRLVSAPEEITGWRQADEGSLLAMGSGWGDTWPVEAQEAFRLALRKDPRYMRVYPAYAEFLAAREKWDDLIAELAPFQTLHGKRPEDAAIVYDALARAHRAKGEAVLADKFATAATASRERMITRHSQVVRLMFHIPTLPREGFNDQ